MAKKKQDGASWLMSYSDMVTLLLIFFILLVAVSTIEEERWERLVRAMNPFLDEAGIGYEGDPDSELEHLPDDLEQQDEDLTFEELYEMLREHIDENDLSDRIELIDGDGYVFVMFTGNILFDGDSYVIRSEGREVLDFMSTAIGVFERLIEEIQILGHTNQRDPERANPIRGDRFLASNRAAEVLVFIEERRVINPQKLISIGYGQHFPIAPFVLEEDRMLNRRVEILISEAGNEGSIVMEDIYAQVRQRFMRDRT